MTIQAILSHYGDSVQFVADVAYTAGQVIQLSDGRAAVVTNDVAALGLGAAYVNGIFIMQKTATMVLLKGGRAFWDASANAVYFRKINDQDFYVGRVRDDAASADTTVAVVLNDQVQYDIDLQRDGYISVPVGTQAAGGFGRGIDHGGVTNLLISATSEAQKIDALSKDGFALGSNAIVEFAFSVPTGSASGTAQDLSIGIASATNATDADAIAKHCLMHLDGGSTKINFQSKDGTTTVAATDSTKVVVAGNTNAAGVRVEVWMDMRDPSSVKIYVDGVAVLTSTTFSLTAVTTTTLYLLAHLEKTTGTDTLECDVDWLRARFATI
jgi:predicted RecA/RadA family phage recombinase